jgi:integrase
MATVRKRGNSYFIRAYAGYDVNKKQIEKVMTWKPDANLSEKQIEKQLKKVVSDFENKIASGQSLSGDIRFADFAEKWLESNEKQFAPSYFASCKLTLTRINKAIGHIRLDKLQPHHLMEFYKNLSEAGVKQTTPRAVTQKLADLIKEKKITKVSLAATSGVSTTTISTACKGKNINLSCAEKIAFALDMDTKSIFTTIHEKETLSDKTILYHHRIISNILQAAVYWQVITDNVARRVKSPKVERKEAKYLDNTEAVTLVKALEDATIKWKTVVMLLLFSGMRKGELLGLEWPDIDFENNIIQIQRASQYLPSKGIFTKDTKNSFSVRTLKLPPDIFKLLQQYKIWQNKERLMQGDRWEESNRLFVQENGLPMFPDSPNIWLDKFIKDNDLPHFSPHTLRHTNISLMIAAGVPMRNVSARAGHADMTTTSKIYAHAIKTADEMASEAINDILSPAKAKIKKA